MKNNKERSRPDTHTNESTCGIVHICKKRKKSLAIVNEKIVIKCCNFHTLDGSITLIMALWNRQTDLHALNNFSSSIDRHLSRKTAGLWVLYFWRRSYSYGSGCPRHRVMP